MGVCISCHEKNHAKTVCSTCHSAPSLQQQVGQSVGAAATKSIQR